MEAPGGYTTISVALIRSAEQSNCWRYHLRRRCNDFLFALPIFKDGSKMDGKLARNVGIFTPQVH